uniref:Retrovirus-related Pol polyprotein from transposon TNT 1-94 n=1 Tax=Cajanus cajan TaxID=3821 RepID=A0A151SQ50_CAJCA|nr:Retrovirus-related Pol polyprotein from transposon TNT 1-94 [Cajanus cajan]
MNESRDPQSFKEACTNQQWREAMDAEMKAIERNHTWELVNPPEGVTPIGVKWIFKTKFNESGHIEKYKARLVAKGYAQRFGIDYTEVFAPVARLDTVRLILALVAQNAWKVMQLDVKSAFLHGELQEEVYVQQPKGFIKKGKEDHIYRLKKALYGLKQAPRAWYSKIEAYFAKERFERCSNEHTLFTKRIHDNILIVRLYVDDLIFTGNSKDMCDEFKNSMKAEFDMTDLGHMRHFLGIEVIQSNTGIFICQRQYAHDVLARFNMTESNSVRNPIVPGTILSKDIEGSAVDATKFKQVVGSLMYLTVTRPDLMFRVSLISRYMANPKESHWAAAKRLLRYLKGTLEYGIFYQEKTKTGLMAYSDNNYAGDLDDRRSTYGAVLLIGNGAVSWMSKKQPVVSLSTTEAEYIAAASCACQCIWIQRILEHLSSAEKEATEILCDNSSTIQLSKNPVFHGRSKHIAVRFHFLRDLVNDKVVRLTYCCSNEQVANIMTKALNLDQFEKSDTCLELQQLLK